METFVSREVVEAAIPPGITERPPITGTTYRAFTDPSGGASDSMTLAISHQVGERMVLDLLRERKAPFSPESVVTEFAGLLKRYGLSQVTGDRYAGEWPREAFQRHGITYLPAEQAKSAIYLDLLPKLNSGEVELLDVPVLATQLITLERRTARGGRDSIDHAPGAHDDVANAVAGALVIRTQSAPVAAVTHYTINRGGVPRNVGPAPEWFTRGDRYEPGDPRWKLDIAKGLISRDEAIANGWIKEA